MHVVGGGTQHVVHSRALSEQEVGQEAGWPITVSGEHSRAEQEEVPGGMALKEKNQNQRSGLQPRIARAAPRVREGDPEVLGGINVGGKILQMFIMTPRFQSHNGIRGKHAFNNSVQ